MRRIGGLWPQVVAFDNLLAAARRAAKGKRDRAAVAAFRFRLEPECLALQRALEAGEYWPGLPVRFRIFDPKERTISAAPFRDRVVHHAVIRALEPAFERRMIDQSFACRKGKGTHAALRYAHAQVRRHRWFLKIDVARFFESLQHDVVLRAVACVAKDRRLLALCETIVRATPASEAAPGRGLPIGNLTSQWFANLVLDRLDHFVKEELRIPGFCRYMDDAVLFTDDRRSLQRAARSVDAFVRDELRLKLKKGATILAPVSQGLPFLGWRIYRGTIRLRPENLRRTRRRLRHQQWEYLYGHITEEALADATRSVCAHLRHGRTRRLRQRWFQAIRDGPAA